MEHISESRKTNLRTPRVLIMDAIIETISNHLHNKYSSRTVSEKSVISYDTGVLITFFDNHLVITDFSQTRYMWRRPLKPPYPPYFTSSPYPLYFTSSRINYSDPKLYEKLHKACTPKFFGFTIRPRVAVACSIAIIFSIIVGIILVLCPLSYL
jgi:hypothetical protein